MSDAQQILQLKAQGKTLGDIADLLGRTYDSVRWEWRKLKEELKLEVEDTAASVEVDPLPLKPIVFSPAIPAGGSASSDGVFVSVHYGDTHYPFADADALAVFIAILRDLQPDLIAHHGDLLDCYSISRYEKNPAERVTLQDEIGAGARHLAEIAKTAPDARRLLLCGNHEDRLRRLIWKMSRDFPARSLLQLEDVRAALDWPSLLGLESSGWEWHEDKVVLFDRLILKHGTTVRKWSGYSAKAERERYSKSGMSGHTHRMGAHFHRDWNGQHGWWELGCLCDLNPEYVEDPDWQQGFAVITWNEDRTHFTVEPVHIHEGQAAFRGNIYTA